MIVISRLLFLLLSDDEDSHCKCFQRSTTSERPVTAAVSSDVAPAASNDDDGMIVGGKPFYPEVTISHVETPSKFYVLELSRKDSLSA